MITYVSHPHIHCKNKRPCLLTPTSGGNKSHGMAIDTDSVAIRATKQLLTPTSVPGFPSYCPLPGFGSVTCKRMTDKLFRQLERNFRWYWLCTVQYIISPSRLLHSKLLKCNWKADKPFRLKKFAIISNILTKNFVTIFGQHDICRAVNILGSLMSRWVKWYTVKMFGLL